MSVSRETLLGLYFKGRVPEIERFAEILATRGIERGVIGPREADRIWDRHIANCIPVTTLIKEGSSVVDIGSGAGLPGIVLALARPDLTITLIEPLQRRVDFLVEVVAELNLPIMVVRGRAEIIKGSFNVVTARAVAPLVKLIPMVWHLIAPKGSLLAIKGESAQKELDEVLAIGRKKGSDLKLHTLTFEAPLQDLGPARIIEVFKVS